VTGPLDTLLSHRGRFLGFVRARVIDRESAEDVLQLAYTKVFEHPAEVPVGHEVPWFYRVLRNAVIDRHRRLDVEGRQRDQWEHDPTRVSETEQKGRLCRCTMKALASLKPQHAGIIKEVDLLGRSVVDVARTEGLSTTNAYVRLHRARRTLGERLRGICRSCADNACVDCHCKGS
jgi:RNA polymerase sigma-70 factor (ECF subfamily)